MRIGLIDVDGHHFPNLALMRISAYHKARGDEVEWWWTDLIHYDIVYKSKVFSEAYSQDVPDPMNCDRIIKGGTGYAIRLVDGREVFDEAMNTQLPAEIEHMFPDYSIYPQYDFAVSMTSRGCPRGCRWCVVGKKEGRCSHKVADVKDFWCGQKKIEVMDPNILACDEKRDLLRQYRETSAKINYNQGLDVRFMDDADIEDINGTRIQRLHFAWDNPKEDLEERFRYFAGKYRLKQKGTVYTLVNFDSSMEENLHRIYVLRDLGYDPYVMVYDKPHAPREVINLQRWCNNKFVFKKVPRFENYLGSRHYYQMNRGNGGGVDAAATIPLMQASAGGIERSCDDETGRESGSAHQGDGERGVRGDKVCCRGGESFECGDTEAEGKVSTVSASVADGGCRVRDDQEGRV